MDILAEDLVVHLLRIMEAAVMAVVLSLVVQEAHTIEVKEVPRDGSKGQQSLGKHWQIKFLPPVVVDLFRRRLVLQTTDGSATQFLSRAVHLFQDSNAQTQRLHSVSLFQDSSANLFQVK